MPKGWKVVILTCNKHGWWWHSISIKHWLGNSSVLSLTGVHVFGLCSTALITDIIQLSTGYQAPYFLTVCKPNYTSLNVSCKENSYIVEDICSGSDLTVINSGRLETEILKLSMSMVALFFNSLGYHLRHIFFSHNAFGFIFLFSSVISFYDYAIETTGGSF